MKIAYGNVRIRAVLPHDALPDTFGIVTAYNPDGITVSEDDNNAANARLRSMLVAQSLHHFPVTGGAPDFTHSEPGFGILNGLDECLNLGRAFRQEAIFWVYRGEVRLVSCTNTKEQEVGRWHEIAEGPAGQPEFHFRGNPALLTALPAAFLCSNRCTGEEVLNAYDWARAQCDSGGTVISGFHSPVEQDVFAILSRRGAHLIWVPGRDLPKVVSSVHQELIAENRLLIATPFPYGKPTRPSRKTCLARNEWVLARAASRWEPSSNN